MPPITKPAPTKTKNQTPPVKAKANKPEPPKEREVKYPEVEAFMAVGEDAIDDTFAGDLIGWCTDEAEAKEHGLTDPSLTDLHGRPVWLLNNMNNRPIYWTNTESLIQTILHRRWTGPNGNGQNDPTKTINGEPIIIGRYGTVLNGQHTLIAVKIAQQMVEGGYKMDSPQHWEEYWPNKDVKVDKLIIYGIDESDETVNTMDTAKARSLSDVIFRSEYFKSMAVADRKKASKIAQFAVRMLWKRTGAKDNSFAPILNHDEAISFLGRHNRVLKCIKHVVEEDKKGALSAYVPPGVASAMMYLMGACHSDGDAYRHEDPERRNETMLDFSAGDQATKFWTDLAKPLDKSENMMPVRRALGALGDANGTGGSSVEERLCVLCKAWDQYINGADTEGFVEEDLAPTYHTDGETGIKQLKEFLDVGGIDIGSGKTAEDVVPEGAVEDGDGNTTDAEPPDEEELEVRKAEVRGGGPIKVEDDSKEAELAARARADAQQQEARKATPGKKPKPIVRKP